MRGGGVVEGRGVKARVGGKVGEWSRRTERGVVAGYGAAGSCGMVG